MNVTIVSFHDKCANVGQPKELASVQCYGVVNAIQL
jgi:hypothetical protein